MKGEGTRRIVRPHSGCCYPHTETWRSVQNSMRFYFTRCKMHWDWRRNFRTFVTNCSRFFIFL